MSDQLEPGRLLREQIDAQLADAGVVPDLEDVLERAWRIDEQRVQAYAEDDDDRRWLAPFITAYRDRLDTAIDELRPPGPPRTRTVMPWVAVLVAAALLVLTAGAVSWLSDGRLAARLVRSGGAHEAQHGAQGDDSGPAVAASRRQAPARRATDPATRPEREAGPAPEASVPVADPPEPDHAADAAPSPPAAPRREDRLAALDAAAQAAWRRGDLRQAERLYRKLVRQGGRREVAELAYGELFAIVRQRGGDLEALWRAYLRRFPRGRYAEDVQAGLCRRVAATERDACWARYRQRFPNGIHAP